jgi:PEP-CTERM motif-containing protein
MSRFTLRFIPLLALLFALSAVARADSFQITFTGIGSGTGQFTTDGVCTMCSPGAGLLTWLVEVGPDTGPNAFDITDDGIATMTITYDRLTNSFDSIGTFNSENNDFFILHSTLTWSLSSLQGDFSRTYTVAPVASTPEPSTLLLLFLSALALASGMAWRRKTPYVTVLSTPAANPW